MHLNWTKLAADSKGYLRVQGKRSGFHYLNLELFRLHLNFELRENFLLKNLLSAWRNSQVFLINLKGENSVGKNKDFLWLKISAVFQKNYRRFIAKQAIQKREVSLNKFLQRKVLCSAFNLRRGFEPDKKASPENAYRKHHWTNWNSKRTVAKP